MEKYPQPPPDRRLSKRNSQQNVNAKYSSDSVTNVAMNNSKIKYDDIDNISYKHRNSKTDKDSINPDQNKENSSMKDSVFYESSNKFEHIKSKNIEDTRNEIMKYRLLSDKKMFLNVSPSQMNLNSANFVLFGPSGSGKSSFIRTLYKALHAKNSLPNDFVNKLVIKNSYENEGTLCFLRMMLKEETSSSSGIKICDTRGHLLMNSSEQEQFKLIVEGKVKDNSKVVQSSSRNPFLLWEFWLKDEELFPTDILNKDNPGINAIPHTVALVFDGSSDDIINPEEVGFYRNLVSYCSSKGYNNIHVILTRVDLLEELAYKKNQGKSKEEIQNMIYSIKDTQIEKVIECLGVKRSNVHFIENYLSEKSPNNVDIDYHVLKALNDMINSAEQYLLMYFNKNTSCFSTCF